MEFETERCGSKKRGVVETGAKFGEVITSEAANVLLERDVVGAYGPKAI